MFRTTTLLLSALLLPVLSTSITANELDLRISDDSVHANFAVTDSYSSGTFGMGYFYKDEDEAINVINLDVHTKGQTAIGNMPTTVGLGIQGTYFKEDHFKGSAAAVGGSVRINVPSAPGVSLETEAHYAPNVLSFGDSDSFARLRLQGNYRIIQSADISLGYRYLRAGIEDGGHRTFESGAFIGMKLKF